VNQTWADLRRGFERAKLEQRIISSTASGARYHTSNESEHYVQSQLPAYGGFVTSMSNLVTATSADRETVATLTKEIWPNKNKQRSNACWVDAPQMRTLSLLDPLEPTSGNLRRPRMTITVGHMAIRSDWPTQVPTASRKLMVARMKQPRTTSWEVTLGAANFFDEVGTFR
jgi:hypothetical protein